MENSGEPSNSEVSDDKADTTRAPSTATRVERPFPRRTLEQALRVAQVIRDNNGGNPWAKDQIAEALGIKSGSSNMVYLLGSARDFGLTRTTSEGPIELTPLGREAVYPSSDAQETQAKLDAFNNIELFKRVVEHYGGNNLPERRYLDNTLQKDFGLNQAVLDEFVDLFEKNCKYVGIGTTLPQTPATKSAGAEAAPQVRVTTKTENLRSTDKPVCFVIMPFTERSDRHETGFFKEVLSQIFTPALEEAGFEVRTALKKGSDIIQATIVTELLRAEMVLADLTEHNPNVLFELGVRMKEELPVALVRAKGTGPIFDVDNMLRVEEYSPNLWPTTVKEDVPKIAAHAKATFESHGKTKTFMQILTEQG